MADWPCQPPAVDANAEIVLNAAKSGDFQQLHHIIQQHVGEAGKQLKFKMGNGRHFEFHSDGKNTLSVIEKLIENSDLTPEQLNSIQAMIDKKRN